MSPDHADVQITLDDRSRTFTGGAGGVVSGLRTQVRLLLFLTVSFCLSSDPNSPRAGLVGGFPDSMQWIIDVQPPLFLVLCR